MSIKRTQNVQLLKEIYTYLSSQALLFISFFQLCRFFFIIYHKKRFHTVSFNEILYTFYYGLRLDVSATAYVLTIPFLVYLTYVHSFKLTNYFLQTYSYICLSIIAILTSIDTHLCYEWGYKMNSEVFSLLRTPKEVFASSSNVPFRQLLFSGLSLLLIGYFLCKQSKKIIDSAKVFTKKEITKTISSKSRFVHSIFLFIAAFLLLPAIRGGWQLSPINPSFAYFSFNNLLNHTALNTVWNLGYSFNDQLSNSNPYTFFTQQQAKQLVDSLNISQNTIEGNIYLLKDTKKPKNVVLIILESFTVDIVADLGGIADVTPRLNRIIDEGVLFADYYASGGRTYVVLPAILSGYPSLPKKKLLKYTQKFSQIPCLAQVFNNQGYTSSFYYGGEMEFGNIKAYALTCGFDHLIDQYAFAPDLRTSKWGVYDHLVFEPL